MGEPGNLETPIDKASLLLKPVLRVLCLTVIVLSVAGAATSSDPSTAQGLFIAILFFSCLAAFLVVMCRVLRSSGSGKSKYQINEKGGRKTGEVNGGYDDEKAGNEVKLGNGQEGGQEPWMNNYVPYGKNPSGNPIEQVTFTNEQEREGGENTENKEEMKKNWKENYVPYDDNKEEGGDNKDKKEVEKVAEEDADEEEERHGDEKDSYEKEVDGKEKL